MTMEALKFRLGQIVEKDWKGHAEALLDNRKTNGEKVSVTRPFTHERPLIISLLAV